MRRFRLHREAKAVTAYNSWRELTPEEIALEYKVEYHHVSPIYGDVWPTLEDFVRAVRSAKVMEVTRDRDRSISYRSQSQNIESLKSLVAAYRFPRDIDRIVRGFQNHERIPYPIVLNFRGKWRIMGGNSRMDTAFILGFNPKVKLVEVPVL